jgi:hypothetical protein
VLSGGFRLFHWKGTEGVAKVVSSYRYAGKMKFSPAFSLGGGRETFSAKYHQSESTKASRRSCGGPLLSQPMPLPVILAFDSQFPQMGFSPWIMEGLQKSRHWGNKRHVAKKNLYDIMTIPFWCACKKEYRNSG